MIKINHTPEFKRNIVVTPHLRFFKNVHLLEVGADTRGKIMFNYYDIKKRIFMQRLILFYFHYFTR